MRAPSTLLHLRRLRARLGGTCSLAARLLAQHRRTLWVAALSLFACAFAWPTLTASPLAVRFADALHPRGLRVGGACTAGSPGAGFLSWFPSLASACATVGGGGEVVSLSPYLPQATYEALLDVLVVSVYCSTADDGRAAATRAHRAGAVVLFVSGENTESLVWANGGFADHMIGTADLSLSHMRGAAEEARPDYQRAPFWLSSFARISPPCVFPTGWDESPRTTSAATAAGDAWAARPGFAALLSSHAAYPRRELFDALTAFGAARRVGRVDAPSGAFKNMDTPLDMALPGSKAAFLTGYRFIISPENSRSKTGGYNTEKVVDAHMAGVIPIYWGDTPFEPLVFNQRRILVFDERRAVGGGGMSGVLATIEALETNSSARADWFAQPLLAPGARAWLASWCANLSAKVAALPVRKTIY